MRIYITTDTMGLIVKQMIMNTVSSRGGRTGLRGRIAGRKRTLGNLRISRARILADMRKLEPQLIEQVELLENRERGNLITLVQRGRNIGRYTVEETRYLIGMAARLMAPLKRTPWLMIPFIAELVAAAPKELLNKTVGEFIQSGGASNPSCLMEITKNMLPDGMSMEEAFRQIPRLRDLCLGDAPLVLIQRAKEAQVNYAVYAAGAAIGLSFLVYLVYELMQSKRSNVPITSREEFRFREPPSRRKRTL